MHLLLGLLSKRNKELGTKQKVGAVYGVWAFLKSLQVSLSP